MKSNILPSIALPNGKKKSKNSKVSLRLKEPDDEENYIFKCKTPRVKIASPSPIFSSSLADSRISFFESFKKLPLLSKRNPEETTVSLAYLAECDKKGLNPIPIGLARSSMSTVNIRNYSMGDNYAKAFSKGITQVKNLENLNLKANNLSPRGTSDIISKISEQPLKELDLRDNQITVIVMTPLIGLIQKEHPLLKYLNLENTGIGDKNVGRLCEALANDRMLNFLGLAMNNLTPVAALALKNMLIENQYLKKLDLHWNCLKDIGAMLLFEGLSRNDSLKELDLSWNAIGKKPNPDNIKKIANILPKVQGLAHLDLSFNYLTAFECTLIGEGLKNNHDILGLHLLGNEGYIDGQGFIIPSQSLFAFEQSHLFCRIFENSKGHKKPSKSKCWICEKWVEMNFVWPHVQGGSNQGEVYIHLECDDYEPDLMKNGKGEYSISRVVPPGEANFFFSKSSYPMRSKEYDFKELKNPIQKEVHYSSEYAAPVIMHIINKIIVTGKTCDYRLPFMTVPRKPRFFFAPPVEVPKRLQWSIKKSLFKSYRVLDKVLAQECFEFDWNQSKLPSFIKSSEHKALKAILSENYYEVIETFRYLASQSGNEFFTVGSNVLTDFLNQGKALDELYEASDFGVNWSSTIVPKGPKQPFNPGNALVRYEFMELLVRIAYDRYVRNKICQTAPEAIRRFFQDKMFPMLSINDSNKFRENEYFTEEIDVVLKAHKPILDSIYKIYSGRKSLPGQKPFMCIEEFRQLCIDGRLIPEKLSARYLDSCFSLAIMVQVDELFEKKHIEMTFTEFLEGLCRVCWYFNISADPESAKIQDDFTENTEPDLVKKVEKAMWNLYSLCPKLVQDSFVFPTQQTYKTFMYQFDKKPTSLRDIYKDSENT